MSMFHEFSSQEERREFGGSCFLEIQYCRLAQGTPICEIMSIDSIKNWENDSLYVHGDDQAAFYDRYAGVLGWKTFMETYGISYYSCEQTAEMIAAITETQPAEWQTMARWLERAKDGNGFYILGI